MLEYISTAYKQGDYVAESINNGAPVQFPDPKDCKDPEGPMLMRCWEYKMKKQEDSTFLLREP